jgi:hypothetical protein
LQAPFFSRLGKSGIIKQPNSAMDSDNYSAPLRAPSIARHRER